MSKSICFYFQVHQPFRLRTYRFFDIGKKHFYYDEYKNRTIMQRVAEHSYRRMNEILMEQIGRYGDKVKYAFSFSGSALDQMEQYAPDVLDGFRLLVATGNVEVLSETVSHSLASLYSPDAFKKQVSAHKKMMRDVFGVTPKTFHNTELIYSNEIGSDAAEMGYDLIVTEGAKHVLGWKSPNFMYTNAINPKLKVLLRNFKLSDEITFRFAQNNVTAESYIDLLNQIPDNEEIVNIFVNYDTFGELQDASTGIFDFMKYLPEKIFENTDFRLAKPHELVDSLQPMGVFDAPIPLSCSDEERDLSAWLGNDMQEDAFKMLYDCYSKIKRVKDEDIIRDWNYLQNSDNFYYMCTKYLADGTVHKFFNNYNSPYDAYINFMNVLTDFNNRVEESVKHKVTEVALSE